MERHSVTTTCSRPPAPRFSVTCITLIRRRGAAARSSDSSATRAIVIWARRDSLGGCLYVVSVRQPSIEAVLRKCADLVNPLTKYGEPIGRARRERLSAWRAQAGRNTGHVEANGLENGAGSPRVHR